MSRLFPLLLCISLVVAACGDDSPSSIIDTTAEGGAGAAPGDACEGVTTQACFCPDGRSGSQSCMAGGWSECSCTSGTNNSGGTSGGTSTTGDFGGPAGDLCKAGYFTGEFYGEYWPGIFDPGAIFGGIGSLISVNVSALAKDGQPGLALTLEKEETEGGALDGVTFSTYTVKNGCVVGTAEAAGTENPFVGVLTGELDCETGKFEGRLKGYYELLGFSELPFGFEGPVSGQYYADQEAINDGMWMVEEESMAASPPGGSGTWNTKWTGDVEDAPPLPQECLDFLAGEVETTTSDEVNAGADGGAGSTDGGVDGG